jgi:competence protein ComGC
MKNAEMSFETLIKFLIVITVVVILIFIAPKMINQGAHYLIQNWTPR